LAYALHALDSGAPKSDKGDVRNRWRSGKQAGARDIVSALKRLEYRGYDSAGVATLEGGRLTGCAPKASSRISKPSWIRRRSRDDRHRPHPLGDARQAERSQRPSARQPRVAVVHNGIIENFKRCARS